jgi:hypothetical protein
MESSVFSSEQFDKNCVHIEHEISCVHDRLVCKDMISLGRIWCRWEENIIFILKEIGMNGEHGINLAMQWDAWHALL